MICDLRNRRSVPAVARVSRLSRAWGFGMHGVKFSRLPGDLGVPDPDDTPEPSPTPAPTNAPAPTPANPPADPNRNARLAADRRRARGAFRALARAIGLDPERLQVHPTDDPGSPWRVVGLPEDRLEAIRAMMHSSAAAPRRAAGADPMQVATLTGQRDLAVRQRNALTRYVNRTSIIEPIRVAARQLGAIDDDNGQFSDIVALIAPQFTPNVEFDEENPDAEPEVRVIAKNPDGSIKIDPKTSLPLTPHGAVAHLLETKSKFRSARYRGGPGAGGANTGVANANSNGNRVPAAQLQGNADRAHSAGVSEDDLTTATALADYMGVPVAQVLQQNRSIQR